MAKKTNPVVVPTGDYAIKMPTTVSITAENVPVVQNTKEVKQGIFPDFWWWLRLWMRIIYILLLLACILIILHQKRPDLFTFKYWIEKINPPARPPQLPPDARVVVSEFAWLYAEPPESEDFNRSSSLVLQRGTPVEYLGQDHETSNGIKWVKVKYRLIAGEVEHNQTGWINSNSLSELSLDSSTK